MLLNQKTLKGIESGAITVAFRRWRRPTVKADGTLLTPIGQLAIEAVDVVPVRTITRSQAAAAGYSSVASLKSELNKRTEGDVYRVRLSLSGPDPRVALRTKAPGAAELDELIDRLARLDARAAGGPWTRQVLTLIRDRPGENSSTLAEAMGVERAKFKINVRKLKALGLTESRAVGYRLSPRGRAVWRRLTKRRD